MIDAQLTVQQLNDKYNQKVFFDTFGGPVLMAGMVLILGWIVYTTVFKKGK